MEVSHVSQADLEQVKALLDFIDRADFKVSGRDAVPLAQAMDWFRQTAGKVGKAWQGQRGAPAATSVPPPPPERNVTPPDAILAVPKKGKK